MKKIKKGGGALLFLLLLGVWCAARADMEFRPFVRSYPSVQSANWEQDAEVRAEVWWLAPGLPGYQGVIAADGSYLYDAANVFEWSGTKPFYLDETGLPGLSSIIDGQYRLTAGSALFSRTIPASGSPIGFSSQGYRVYVPVLQVRSGAPAGPAALRFNTSFAKVLGKDDAGVTRTISGPLRDLITIMIYAAAAPTGFTGPTAANNIMGTLGGRPTTKPVGNSVKIDWTDLNADPAGPFAHDETPPIKYDVYMHEKIGAETGFDNPANESKVITNAINLSGSFVTLGGNGEPGAPALKDKTTYFFRMRAKDSSTTPDVLGRHKTTNTDTGASIVSVHVNDYSAPETFAITGMDPRDKTLTVTWSEPSENKTDIAGYILIRKEATDSDPDPALPSPLGGASGDSDGPSYDSVTVGNEIMPASGWIKVYQGGARTKEDGGLDNRKRYKYAVYAYDRTNANEQGRNYSTVPATRIGQPGEAPNAVTNFIAVSSPEARQITLMWDVPSYYAGAKVVYTTSKDEWMALSLSSPEAIDLPASGNPSEVAILTQIGGEPLNMSKIYYFKAFSYNDARMSKTEAAVAASLPAGAGGGGAGSVPFTFRKVTGGLGLNDLAVVHEPPIAVTNVIGTAIEVTNVRTIADFVNAVNRVAGGAVVTAIGWMKDGKIVGYYINADGSYTATEGAGVLPNGEELLALGRAYQISVNQDVSIVMKK